MIRKLVFASFIATAITLPLSFIARASCVTGSLTGSVTTYSTTQSINLTSLGATDWAAFGYTANASSIARKNGGGSLISALSQVGTQTLANYNNTGASPIAQSTWTDGASPNTSATNEGYLVYSGNGVALGSGMSFTVPADTTSRTLKIYVSVYPISSSNTAQGKLTATLSDGSAGPYTDTTITGSGTANVPGTYTIVYNAAAAGQTLTITWTNNTSIAQNAQIYAVTLN